MNPIHYHNRRFRAVHNSGSGEVDGTTVFHYRQEGQVVWATYAGGAIQQGVLVATVTENGRLHMRYSHVNQHGDLMTGQCESVPELLENGRLRLHESWQWTSGDHSSGTSVIEEFE